MKKAAAIVFGITGDYTFALANVLLGMKKHCLKFWDDIIIYNTDISQRDKECLNKILPCNFIAFPADKITSQVNGESLKQYSLLSMARFECFDLLKTYQYVIWHDVDILVQSDFSELLECGKESGFALTCDSSFFMEQNFFKVVKEYDMLTPLYNSGIMVINDELKHHETMTQYCYNQFNKYGSIIRYFDQAILNMMIQDFDINVGYIDLDRFCCHPSKRSSNTAAIVHAYGSDKFWSAPDLKMRFPEWEINNNEWLMLMEGARDKETDKYVFCNEKPKVTVIMSVYKWTSYLDDAINSILNQTYTNFEFIIIIEYSDEQEKVKNYISNYNDERIITVCNDSRIGFAASLNIGLEMAKGEYIARMDDDDISLPERFQKQVQFLNDNLEITVVGSFIKMFMNSNELCKAPKEMEAIKVRALNETPLYHPTVMMRKKDMDSFHFRYDPNYFTEDYELWCRMLHHVKVSNLQEVLLLYRASGNNTTAQKREEVWKSHVAVVKRNFKENLHIDLTNDEIYLLERPEILEHCYNMEALGYMRHDVVDKIKHANAIYKVYDNKLLEEKLKIYKPCMKVRLTRKLQKFPLILKIAKIVYGIIATDGEYSHLFHKKRVQ